jgi:murein hydrolase activator
MNVFIDILRVLLVPLLTLLLVLGPAHAEPAEELSAVEAALAATTEKQAALVQQMAEAIRAQEDASTRLVDLAKTAAGQEAFLAAVQKKLAALQRDNATALLALASKREAMSKLLAGLQRLEQNPPPALVVAPDDVLLALRGAMLFGTVIPDLRQQTDALRRALGEVETIKLALEGEQRRSADALAALEQTRRDIAAMVAERQEAAETLARALDGERARSEQLVSQAKTLKELVAALATAKAQDAARLEQEEDAKAAALALAEAQRRKALERPAMRFSESRGKLNFPVAGEIWRSFGADNGLEGTTAGVFLTTQSRAQVLSPVDGVIEFAGNFRSYDQVVIVNPGEGYLVLLAGMNEITGLQGQSIRAGEPLGVMGDKPAPLQLVADLAQVKTPVLYVEFRKKNEPVDPTPWWNDRRKEAMR